VSLIGEYAVPKAMLARGDPLRSVKFCVTLAQVIAQCGIQHYINSSLCADVVA
jgi:hypothetical protein